VSYPQSWARPEPSSAIVQLRGSDAVLNAGSMETGVQVLECGFALACEDHSESVKEDTLLLSFLSGAQAAAVASCGQFADAVMRPWVWLGCRVGWSALCKADCRAPTVVAGGRQEVKAPDQASGS
jgi:hypothetical protein